MNQTIKEGTGQYIFTHISNETIDDLKIIINGSEYKECYAYYIGSINDFNFYLDKAKVIFKQEKLILKKDAMNYVSIPFSKVDKIEVNATLYESVIELYTNNRKEPVIITLIY